MKKVTIIGAGSFGIALGILLAEKGNEVNIYDIDKSVVDDININKKNDKYIKGLNIPNNLNAYNDLDEDLINANYVLLAVPSHIIRNICKKLIGKINCDVPIISIAKGMEIESGLRLSQV